MAAALPEIDLLIVEVVGRVVVGVHAQRVEQLVALDEILKLAGRDVVEAGERHPALGAVDPKDRIRRVGPRRGEEEGFVDVRQGRLHR